MRNGQSITRNSVYIKSKDLYPLYRALYNLFIYVYAKETLLKRERFPSVTRKKPSWTAKETRLKREGNPPDRERNPPDREKNQPEARKNPA